MSVWTALVGQDRVVEQLRAAAAAAARVVAGSDAEPAMTHAWLFTGPPGSGRSVAARAFAAALQCPNQGCGTCLACHTVLAGTHPDVDVVVPAGLHLLIDEARAVVARSARRPVQGRWQVLVLEDADRMEERTSNTLLKAVEEPPPRAVMLLCAPSAEELLPTIRSRCRLVSLRTPEPAAVAAELRRRDAVDAAMAAFAARAAQSHVGRARRLATDELARLRRRDVLTLPATLGQPGAGVVDCLEAAAALVAASKEEATEETERLDAAETTAFREALGAAGVERGSAGSGGSSRAMPVPRGSAAALRDLEARQRSRSTRSQRDALDRALLDLAAFYRDVLVVQLGAGDSVDPVHPDCVERSTALARASTAAETLRRIEAVLACREAIEGNVAPLLAVETMTLALHSG